MENIHGKDIPLQYVTVKVPGQKPRGSRSIPSSGANPSNSNASQNNNQTDGSSAITSGNLIKGEKKGEKVLLTGYEILREPSGGEDNDAGNNEKASDTPNVKKRHRRIKSNGVKSNQDCDGKKKDFVSSCNFISV